MPAGVNRAGELAWHTDVINHGGSVRSIEPVAVVVPEVLPGVHTVTI